MKKHGVSLRDLTFVGVALACGSVSANQPTSETPRQQQIATTIAQLASEDYGTRETAFKRLASIGTAAREQLVEAQSDGNVNVRLQAKRLLLVIDEHDAQGLRRRMEARIKAFDPAKEANPESSLPGWESYRKIVGEDQVSQELFGQLLLSEARLLNAYERHPEEVPKLFELRRQTIEMDLESKRFHNQEACISLPSMAAMLLVAGSPNIKLPESELLRMAQFALGQPGGWQGGQSPMYAKMQKLLAHWLAQLIDPTMPKLASSKLRLVSAYSLKSHLPKLIQVAANSDFPMECRLLAFQGIYQLGDANDCDSIEPLLQDRTACNALRGEPLQIRDYALATLVKLSGQPWADYGFTEETPQRLYQPAESPNTDLGNFKKRDAGLAKWQKWSSEKRLATARLAAFIEGNADEAIKHGLVPGWKRYREIAGDSPATRKFFVDMQRVAPELLAGLENLERKPAEMVKAFETQLSRLYDWKREPGLPAALLLVASDQDVHVPGLYIAQLSAFLEQEEFANHFAHNQELASLRKLVQEWNGLTPDLQAFANDLDGQQKTSLPGWRHYSKLVGSSPWTRKFFVSMYRHEPELLSAYDRVPNQIAQQVENCLKFYEARFAVSGQEMPGPSAVVLMMLAGDGSDALSEAMQLRMCRLLPRNSEDLDGRNVLCPLNALLVRWLARPGKTTDLELAHQKMTLAVTYGQNSKFNLAPFIELATNPKANAEHRIQALCGIANYGGLEHLETLEPILADRTAYTTPNGNKLPISDVALAVLVHLSNQLLEHYGFNFGDPSSHPGRFYHEPKNFVGLKSDEVRKNSLAKWHAWKQETRGYNQQLAAFKNDLDGKQNLSLPGWDRCRKLLGNDRRARTLFVEMQEAERELLEIFESDPKGLDRGFQTRATQLSQQQPFSAGSLLTLLAIAKDKTVSLSPESKKAFTDVLQNQECVKFILQGEHAMLFKPTVLKWIEEQCAQPGWEDYFYLATAYEMSDLVHATAVKILKIPPDELAKEEKYAWLPLSALIELGKTNDPTNIKYVELLLENEAIIPGSSYAVQYRDAALYVLVRMTEQNWADYGFSLVEGADASTIESYPLHAFHLLGFYFRNKRDREQAIEKWRKWSKENASAKAN